MGRHTGIRPPAVADSGRVTSTPRQVTAAADEVPATAGEVPAAPRRHPLHSTLECLDDRGGFRQILLGRDAKPGWLPCSLIAGSAAATSSPALHAWLLRLQESLRKRNGGTEVPATVAPGYLLSWYLGVPAVVGAGAFHMARRVPSLAPENLAVRVEPQYHYPCAIAVSAGAGFCCLPDDPAAGDPLAEIVPDVAQLAARLRQEMAEHAAGFCAAMAQCSKFGRRTLWGGVADALEAALWQAGEYRGDPAAGVRDARLVLPEVSPRQSGEHPDTDQLLAGGCRMAPIADAGGTEHWCQRRRSCCFHYALAGPEAACLSCPRLSSGQRATRLMQ